MQLIVVASIHQPSTNAFDLFDQILLLSNGKTCYYGPTNEVYRYFDNIGHTVPVHTNPAEFLLDLVNIDFALDKRKAEGVRNRVQRIWETSPLHGQLLARIAQETYKRLPSPSCQLRAPAERVKYLRVPFILFHRSFIKSHRDVIAYGIRLAMYLGLAVMMGTVFLRLPTTQSAIQPVSSHVSIHSPRGFNEVMGF